MHDFCVCRCTCVWCIQARADGTPGDLPLVFQHSCLTGLHPSLPPRYWDCKHAQPPLAFVYTRFWVTHRFPPLQDNHSAHWAIFPAPVTYFFDLKSFKCIYYIISSLDLKKNVFLNLVLENTTE